jgi:hypothetical protein
MEVLGADEALGDDRETIARLFCEAYGIRADGNATQSRHSDPHDEFGGLNIPFVRQPAAQAAQALGLTLSDEQVAPCACMDI